MQPNNCCSIHNRIYQAAHCRFNVMAWQGNNVCIIATYSCRRMRWDEANVYVIKCLKISSGMITWNMSRTKRMTWKKCVQLPWKWQAIGQLPRETLCQCRGVRTRVMYPCFKLWTSLSQYYDAGAVLPEYKFCTWPERVWGRGNISLFLSRFILLIIILSFVCQWKIKGKKGSELV